MYGFFSIVTLQRQYPLVKTPNKYLFRTNAVTRRAYRDRTGAAVIVQNGFPYNTERVIVEKNTRFLCKGRWTCNVR